MKEPSSADIASLLAPYYSVEDQSLIERIRGYIPLLLRWNKRISLTKITEQVEIVRFHFGESLFAASVLKIGDGRLADLGSGAGFPGVPLAMAIPVLRVTLIEANAKKAAFLFEVARRLDLSNITVLRSRMEDVRQVELFDFICARAVGNYASVIRWSRGRLTQKGRLVLFFGRRGRPDSIRYWAMELGVAHKDTEFLAAIRSIGNYGIVASASGQLCST